MRKRPRAPRSRLTTILMDGLMRPFFASGTALSNALSRPLGKLKNILIPALLDFCGRRGWGRYLDEPDDETLLLAKVLWEEAQGRGIRMREFRLFHLPRNLFVAKLPDGTRISFEGIPLPASDGRRVWWLDDKAVMKRKFRKLGFPIAEGGAAFGRAGALRLFHSITPPAIVKPHAGSASRHTTLHINDETELLRAFNVSKQVAPFAVVEEELVGPVFRATLVDGELVASLRRDQPHIVRDGRRTIAELVAQANEHPARGGPYFSTMKLDDAALKELSWQDFTPDSVPEHGQCVTLHQKVNWSLGGTTTDVTDEVHLDNRKLVEDVAKPLRAPIVGIDFIIGDITCSWKEQDRCGVIECNSMPFFDNHHVPFEGEPRNVAGKIWEMTLADY